MKKYTATTDYATYKNCYLKKGTYMFGGHLDLELWNDEEGLIATLTVNLPGFTKENEAYVDTNNCPWAEVFIMENDLGRPTGKTQQSGYCTYPLYEFNMEEVIK